MNKKNVLSVKFGAPNNIRVFKKSINYLKKKEVFFRKENTFFTFWVSKANTYKHRNIPTTAAHFLNKAIEFCFVKMLSCGII